MPATETRARRERRKRSAPQLDPVVRFAGQLLNDFRLLAIEYRVGETAEQTADRVRNQLIDWLYANIPRP